MRSLPCRFHEASFGRKEEPDIWPKRPSTFFVDAVHHPGREGVASKRGQHSWGGG